MEHTAASVETDGVDGSSPRLCLEPLDNTVNLVLPVIRGLKLQMQGERVWVSHTPNRAFTFPLAGIEDYVILLLLHSMA